MRERDIRSLLLALVILTGLGAGVEAGPSEELQALIEQSVGAFATGEADRARTLAEDTVAYLRRHPTADPQQAAFALNNLAQMLVARTEDTARADALLSEALERLTAASDGPSDAWLLVSINLAELHLRANRPEQARKRATELVRAARGTPWHARAAASASSIFFQTGDFPEAATLLEEALAVDRTALSEVYGDVFAAYAQAQEAAEAEARVDDANVLIDGRIAILEAFPVEGVEIGLRSLKFQKFFLFHENARYGAAADALRDWVGTGRATREERDFIDEMASLTLQYTQLAGYSERRSVQLDHAQLAVVFAEVLGDPSDPRLGHALRERAAAEANLGRLAASAQSLRQAAEVLSRSEAGRAELHLVLSDLAANAWRQGDLALAVDLYDRADGAYGAARTAGAPALEPIDQAIDTINRANLQVDLGQPETALELAVQARGFFAADAARGAQKWNSRAEGARIAAVEARALADLGREDAAIAAAYEAVDFARESYPEIHPDLALALANAGDLIGALGRPEQALTLFREAVDIYATMLPSDAPDRVEAQMKLVVNALITGDRPTALEELHQITEARKSPAYREALPEAAFEFELLAWLLLEESETDDPGRLEEAFAALQWTQVTRSADAVSMMEARLAHEEAGLAPILRQRQNLVEAHRRTSSRVLATYASSGTMEPAALAALNARLAGIDADLGRIDADLSALGLQMMDLAPVAPLSISDLQALLSPNEALVTFVLPGLSMDRVAGLDASSNRVIVVTRKGVTVGRVGEKSRRVLDARIRDFRCSIAVSDPGCSVRGAAGLRGAMIDGPVANAGSHFDLAAAYGLYRDLFGDVAGAFAGIDHLIIVPPADLLHLPFQAIVTSPQEPSRLGDAAWFIRDHAISVLPSVPSLRILRAFPSGVLHRRYLGVGNPVIGMGGAVDCDALEIAALRSAPLDDRSMSSDMGNEGLRLADPESLRTLPTLPDTACELRAIGRLFRLDATNLLLENQAREREIKRLDSEGTLAGYDVIVFATHGLTAGDSGAAAPGLVLTPPAVATAEDDGFLTASEIATLDLSARLVVLSACNTAAGENAGADGLSGLARAFFHAGARSVLVTQWAVYSEAAVQISTAFLSEFQASGFEHAAQALRRAQLAIVDDPATEPHKQHPAYWAPFTLVGAR